MVYNPTCSEGGVGNVAKLEKRAQGITPMQAAQTEKPASASRFSFT
jgi:hypothetical protein